MLPIKDDDAAGGKSVNCFTVEGKWRNVPEGRKSGQLAKVRAVFIMNLTVHNVYD